MSISIVQRSRSRISPARRRLIVELIEASLNTPTVVLTDRKLTYATPTGTHHREIPLRIPNANRIVLKCEHLSAFSPTGSMYDRLYPWLFLRAEELGVISPETTDVIECSVGNAGAAFAHVAQRLGYRTPTVIVPADIYDSRIDQIARFLESRVLFSPENIGPMGYIRLLEEMLAERRARTARCSGDRRLYPISKIRRIPLEPYAVFVRETQAVLLSLGYPSRIDTLIFGIGAGNTVSKVGACIRSQTPPGSVVICEHAENPFAALIQGDIAPPVGTSWSEPDYPATTIHGVPLNKLSLDSRIVNESSVLLSTRDQRDEGWAIANEILGLEAGRPTGMFLWGALHVADSVENSSILVPVFDSVAKYRQGEWGPVYDLGPGQVARQRPVVGCATVA